MKQNKVVIYINIVVVVLCISAIFLNLYHVKYFTQLVFSLAFFALLLLIINTVLLRNIKVKEKITDKVRELHSEITEPENINKTADEKNKYVDLLSKIDKKLPIEKQLEETFVILSEHIQLVAGLAYIIDNEELNLKASYALLVENQKTNIKLGDGLTGQVAKEGLPIKIDIVEQIDLEIISGLGKSKPNFLYLLPVFEKKNVIAVVELATFVKIEDYKIEYLIEALKK